MSLLTTERSPACGSACQSGEVYLADYLIQCQMQHEILCSPQKTFPGNETKNTQATSGVNLFGGN